MVLVSHVISQDHVIKGSCIFIARSPKVSYHSVRSGDHRHSDSGDIKVFVCHVTLQDHLIKALNEFMVRSPLRYATILPSLVTISTVIVKT